MTFEELVSAFAERMGLEDFSPDENGTCQLVSEESVITIQNCPEVQKILIVAPVAEIPADVSASVLRKCLEANFMYSGTMGGTLSIDAEHDVLTLTTYLEGDVVNEHEFYDAVMLFATALGKWQQNIKDLLTGDDGESTFSGGPSLNQDFLKI